MRDFFFSQFPLKMINESPANSKLFLHELYIQESRKRSQNMIRSGELKNCKIESERASGKNLS